MTEEGWEIKKILDFFEKLWNGIIKVVMETSGGMSFFFYYKGKIFNEENPDTFNYAEEHTWIVKHAIIEINHAGLGCQLTLHLITPKKSKKCGYVIADIDKNLPPVIVK
ncbi:MAG: hypothetical protein QXL14_03350 [Candidatus Aenigmatarchaeota archaeon]